MLVCEREYTEPVSRENLTYERAMTLAQSVEIAEQNVKELKKAAGAERQVSKRSINNVEDKSRSHRCGKKGHTPAACRQHVISVKKSGT